MQLRERGVCPRTCVLEGDVRSVSFESGFALRERIVAVDDERRRVAYTVLDGRFVDHHASMEARATFLS